MPRKAPEGLPYFGTAASGFHLIVTNRNYRDCIRAIENDPDLGLFICEVDVSKAIAKRTLGLITRVRSLQMGVARQEVVDQIYRIPKIDELIFGHEGFTVDLSRVCRVSALSIHWSTVSEGSVSSQDKLKALTIYGYKDRSKTLRSLCMPGGLTSLTLNAPRIDTFEHLQGFRRLRKLECHRARTLRDIRGLLSCAGTLTHLRLEGCPKVERLEAVLAGLQKLQSLAFVDCGSVASLSFLRSLSSLKSIVFTGTTVRDGDLSHCDHLRCVAFDNVRHYNRKCDLRQWVMTSTR